jgi:hypothetical protein
LGVEGLEGRLAPATLTVNSIADTANPTDPYLSLREAIAIVNSPTLPDGLSDQILAQIQGTLHGSGSDTIGFDPLAVTDPITLGGNQLELSLPGSTARVTIDGGDTGVTVDGNNASRVFEVDGRVQATFDHLTISDGAVPASTSSGGGIYNLAGTLTVSNSTLSANSASEGGGIYNLAGTLTVSNSTLSANSAGGVGGGIDNEVGTVTVTGSTLSGNSAVARGGGIDNEVGTLTVSNSTLSANSAVAGGGIYSGQGRVTVTSSTLSANFAGYSGGGIDNDVSTVTVSSSTLSANSAYFSGGVIYDNGGTLTVSNSTLSANSTGGFGGIFEFGGTVRVSSSTLSANSANFGGGIYIQGGTLALQNTLVAGNHSNASDPDIAGLVSRTSRYNLIGIGTGLGGISDGVNYNHVGTEASPIDPLLAPLDDYGGATQTMPPLPGSPALHAGDPSQVGTPDQRGVLRTGRVNIGAFQASASVIVVTAPATATAGVPFDVSVVVSDQFGQLAVGYTGTITFSTSDPDPGVVLPPDYTFQASDGGMATFSAGVTLFTPGDQTLTVTDLDSGIMGSTVVML